LIILLDIDGVLVTTGGWKKPEILSDNFPQFNKEPAENLREILLKTGASIILTTSHRNSHTLDEWRGIFKTRGIEVSSVGRLEISNSEIRLNRAGEILNWIKKEGQNKSFVIIDDDTSLHGLPADVQKKCILTKGLIGLDKEGAEKAINILKGGN
jgi:hypothetical protein